MMAAAARTSGTRSPLASTLYRGTTVLVISRVVAMERWRAAVALRASDGCCCDLGLGRLLVCAWAVDAPSPTVPMTISAVRQPRRNESCCTIPDTLFRPGSTPEVFERL